MRKCSGQLACEMQPSNTVNNGSRKTVTEYRSLEKDALSYVGCCRVSPPRQASTRHFSFSLSREKYYLYGSENWTPGRSRRALLFVFRGFSPTRPNRGAIRKKTNRWVEELKLDDITVLVIFLANVSIEFEISPTPPTREKEGNSCHTKTIEARDLKLHELLDLENPNKCH